MGLPIWRAPSPEAKDALKADPTAHARSPIRRRWPAGPARSYDSTESSAAALRSPRSSSSRTRLPPPPPVPESRNYLRAPRPEPEPAIHRPGSSLDDRRSLPALTPNFAPAAAWRVARHDSAHEPDTRDRSSYRSRSPWDSIRERDPSRRASPYSTPGRRRHSRERAAAQRAEHREDGDDDSSDNAVSFPPLRRMGRRNIADGPLPSSSLRESWSPATTVDGLGDRERSLSPVTDHWVTDHWVPMFTSIAPDPLPPTADSSFTSAAASASFSNSNPSSRAGSSNSNSAASSRTHLTVPSRRESFGWDHFLRICDTSEDDSASDTEAEDDSAPAPSHPLHTNSHIRSNALRNPYRYSRRVREQVRESAANVRSFYGEVTAHGPGRGVGRPAEDQLDDGSSEDHAEERNTTDEEMPLDQELRDARALLERLARRDDIGDEFWASVGLRRPLADRVERIQQHEPL
ncbi:hypothetical protein P280DRAFT_473510 [Massarina eburnea CBS 473.64]|uniref:Uncharacterized protein n=1 Tax=Massarina eburnea CBS 473.64 TaxID=1395130 RepID=A0A6A6RL03_9PLEO|nr:hypothetical protein P280DRAFT_473510 [Massarina eburnea CBS 473.64]